MDKLENDEGNEFNEETPIVKEQSAVSEEMESGSVLNPTVFIIIEVTDVRFDMSGNAVNKGKLARYMDFTLGNANEPKDVNLFIPIMLKEVSSDMFPMEMEESKGNPERYLVKEKSNEQISL
jgi:hypothetical protein